MYNVEFEYRLLRLLMDDTKLAKKYTLYLEQSYFSTPELKLIYDIIRDLVITTDITKITSDIIETEAIARGINDPEIIRRVLKIISQSSVEDPNWIIEKLEAFVKSQRLKNALMKAVEIIERGEDFHKIINEIDRALSISKETYVDSEYLINNFYKKYRERYGKQNIIATGYRAIDESMFGGLLPGEVVIIMAPPKTGKSTFACNIGYRTIRLNKKPIIHITLELSELDIASIYVQLIGKLRHVDLMSMSEEEFNERVVPILKYMKDKIFIKKFTPGTTTTMHIRSFISSLRAEGKIGDVGLIIVDYDDLLRPTSFNGKSNMYEDAGQIYKDMLALAEYFNCPILTLAQPNREAWIKTINSANKDKIILLEAFDLAHSAMKTFYCTAVFSLNRMPGTDNYILHPSIIRRGSKAEDVLLKGKLDIRAFSEVESDYDLEGQYK